MKTKDSYLELLFENRNKAYGAYELRTHYHNRLLKSFGMALFIAGLFFLAPFVLTKILTKQKTVEDIFRNTEYTIREIVFEKEEVQPTKTVAANRIAEGNYRVVKKEDPLPKEVIKPVDNTATTATASTGTPTDNTGGEPNGGPKEIVVPPVITMNVAAVDVAPSFPGGEKEMMKFLQKHLKYSAFARENGISGRIFVSFIINEKGEITDVQLQNRVEQSLDAEVLRVVNKMPQWSPGIYRGQAVRTAFMLPVTFALK